MNKKTVYVNDTEIMVRSADAAQNSRGIETGWVVFDEAAFMEEESYRIFIGRLRDKRGPLKARLATTPNGFNWLYDLFKGEKHDPTRYGLIHSKTSENRHLDSDYTAMLASSYSQKFLAQELDGEFVSLGGSRVYEFDRKKHVKECKHLFTNSSSQQLFIACDYNVQNFPAIVGFLENNTIYVIGEIYLQDGADVRMMANAINARYKHFSPILVADHTGNTKRDIINIKQTAYGIFKEEGITTHPFHNPNVYKRIANVNGHLFHNRLIICPSCKYLIKDLELVEYKKGGSNEIDKTSNPSITHCSDALGYLCWKLKPLDDNKPKTSHHLF